MFQFGFGRGRAQAAEAARQIADLKAVQDALDRAQAVVEFDLDGVVTAANINFCKVMGYREDEVVGRHHRLFVDPAEAALHDYAAFWHALREGRQQVGECRRIAKGGREVWLQASYSPVLDMKGKPCKVVKYAADVTQQKWQATEAQARIEAISQTLAVIDFAPDGTILDANANFCRTMGYTPEEVRSKHHRMFVSGDQAAAPAYRVFWEALRRGEAAVGEFSRIAKGGHTVHLHAHYYPIRDVHGRVAKVVKYAIDISEQHALHETVVEMDEVISAAQTGDLSLRVGLSARAGNVRNLCTGVNGLLEKISDVVAKVREAAIDIHAAASQIATGNADLSQRTEQAAFSIQRTAASIEEVAASMRQNADNASLASSHAGRASAEASSGGKVVGEVVRTMAEIRRSSGRIVDIISMIDGIAFQTNILALNAAVEAARAGEQGRGFAVVAGEVRNLAQRSAAAARDVKALIDASMRDVDAGAGLADRAGAAMSQIVDGITQVDQLVAAISQASRDQTAGIDQISQAVIKFEDATQQNAALVEQAAAASESLLDRSQEMEFSISAFRLSA